MKHFLFSVLFLTASCLVQAQTTYKGWFDNVTEALQNNYNYTVYNTTLFPDSLVQAEYGDGNGGVALFNVSTQGIGEVFDPKSRMYTNYISEYNPYKIDSIALQYTYNYVYEPSAVPDTLIFQFYAGAGYTGDIDTGTFQANPSTGFPKEPFAIVQYDYVQNLGLFAVGQFKYILGKKDATSGPPRVLAIPTNGKVGISVGMNDLFAFTVSYRPGFSYQAGDTIDETVSPRPTNLHSHFKVLFANTPIKVENYDFEQSLTIETSNRYNFNPGWDGHYIPGTAWTNYDQILWSPFYINSRYVMNDAGTNGFAQPDYKTTYCGAGYWPIIIKLTNEWGSADLTSATISWTVNGIAQKDFQWHGKIPQSNNGYDTATIGSALIAVGVSTIKAWVSNPNGGTDSVHIDDTSTTSFYVNPVPNAHFTESQISPQIILFTPDDQSLTSYKWNFGDGSLPISVVSPSHQYAKKGTYTVYLSVVGDFGCPSKFDTMVVITTNSGISNSEPGNSGLSLYPNPFNSSISIDYDIETSSHVTAELYDALGKEICQLINQAQSQGKYHYVIDAETYHLGPGIYTLRFSTGSGYISKKMVKF